MMGVLLCVMGVLLCVMGVLLCVMGVLLCVMGVLLCVMGVLPYVHERQLQITDTAHPTLATKDSFVLDRGEVHSNVSYIGAWA